MLTYSVVSRAALVLLTLIAIMLLVTTLWRATPSHLAHAASQNTHSISGRVTDSNGNPLAGITVEATAPCDFSKQPVVFIHGWGAGDTPESDPGGFAELQTWFVQDGYVLDCNLFYATGVSHNNTRRQNQQAVQSFMRDTYDQLIVANPAWRGHFDIVGHSYGGLNARFYLESDFYVADRSYGTYGIHVDNLFTLGTPHGGSVNTDFKCPLFADLRCPLFVAVDVPYSL